MIPEIKFKRFSKCLSIAFGDEKEAQYTIYSTSPLVDYSLAVDSVNSDVLLYCCTVNGEFYKLNSLDVDQMISTKANCCSEDVFSDLLEDDGIELSLSTKPVYQLQSCDLLYKSETSVAGLCVCCGFVALTCNTKSGLTVQIYTEKDLGQLGDSKIGPIQIVSLDCPCLSDKHDSEKILTKCLIAEGIVTTHSRSSNCINVSAGLFKAIVGQDACLLGSPAIIVCPPGGSVYFAPIRTLDTSLPIKTDVTYSACSTGFELLCETTNDVIMLDVMRFKIIKDDTVTLNEMLTVCCQNGLVSVLGIPQDVTSDTASFLQAWSFSVDSPIECACSFKDKLYHSTGRFVCETKISLSRQSAMGVKFVPDTQTRRFQLYGVEDITAHMPEGMIEVDDTPCVLHCYHFDGQVTKLNTAEDIRDYKPIVRGNFTDTMKETLLAIESVDKKKEEAEEKLRHFEHLLKQINIVATLYRQYITSHDQKLKFLGDTKQGSVPVKCIFKARLPEGEICDHILVDCVITNQMPCSLSCDWSVMVTIEAVDIDEDCVSRSYKLGNDFGPSQCLTLSIPVNPALILLGLEARVFFILQLPFEESDIVSLCVPVSQNSIDALYFLHSDSPELRCMNAKSLGSSLVHEELMKIAKNRPAYTMLLNSTVEKEMSTVRVSHSISLKNEDSVRSSLKNPADPCSILNYLLQNSAVSQLQGTDNCCYYTSLGQPVYLSVAVDQSEEVGKETSLVTVSVRSDLVTAAACHKAVTCRLQLLAKETGVKKLKSENLKRKLYELQDLEGDLLRLQTGKQCPDINSLATVYEKLRKIASLGQ